MSASAASLSCPLCLNTAAFECAQSLRDRLISVSTNTILCPVCQEEICGLDKLTIHLFSHVKILLNKSEIPLCINIDDSQKIKEEIKNTEHENATSSQRKKSRSTSAKNKTVSTNANTNQMKFIKIYPKLPVVSITALPLLDKLPEYETEELKAKHANITANLETSSNTICNVCGLQFVDVNILKMHRCLIHNIEDDTKPNVTRYNCHLCAKHFKMRGSLMVHLRVAHFGFSSNECNHSAATEPNSEDIKKISVDDTAIHERNDNKQWQCDVCRKCFTTKYFLKKHKRLHTGETPYACTQCNKTFTFQQSYHKHLLYHNDEKPHSCTYCGRAFKELSTLHNHQRIHTGEKPFSCETCGKCFRQRVSYLVHRRIHTGVMPYKCTACDKSFRYKVSQRTHKCQAQPPGTVIRQAGDLVEKLRMKRSNSPDNVKNKTEMPITNDQPVNLLKYTDVSEANAELARMGASLSLQDTEIGNYTIISESNVDQRTKQDYNGCFAIDTTAINPDIDNLIHSIPSPDKNVPSPSEIFQNLCLTTEEDLEHFDNNSSVENFDLFKDCELFMN